MEASIYDTVTLSTQEFDSYVLNNWEWKQKFITSNTLYVDKARGAYGPQGEPGPRGLFHFASNPSGYTAVGSGIMVSGCAGF